MWSARVNHLIFLARNCSEICPKLSQFYLNEIQSLGDVHPYSLQRKLSGLSRKFCHHCRTLFNSENCHMRLLRKRRRGRRSKKGTDKLDHQKGCAIIFRASKVNNVVMFCKICGRKSRFPGLPRTSKGKSKLNASSNSVTSRSNKMVQESTPVLSRSAKKKKWQRSLKLKDILRSEERLKSKLSGTTGPRLQDFLSTLQ